MAGTARPTHWTYADYLRLPDDRRFEIIRGELFEMAGPRPTHQDVAGTLYRLMGNWLDKNPVGKCYISPIDVVLTNDTVVQPDVIFIARKRLGIVTDRAVEGAPDLVVEVLSEKTRKRDFAVKRRLYAAHGVREYWIADPECERVEIFVLEKGELVKRAEATEGKVASLVVLPRLRIPLAKIFA
jgi:Uma2 family endonuclease